MVCPAGDGVALADTLARFAALPVEERQRMGARGQAYARAEFDRETLMSRLHALLEEASSLYRQQSHAKERT